jgi:hypothetical protein
MPDIGRGNGALGTYAGAYVGQYASFAFATRAYGCKAKN